VVDGVLAGSGFHRHRPVGSDEPVRAVSTADGAVVTLLGGGAGDGEVDRSLLVLVGRVDVDGDLAAGVVLGERRDELADAADGVVVLLEAGDVCVDHRGRDRDVDAVALAFTHHLDVRPEFGVVRAVGRDEFAFRLVNDPFRLRQRRVPDPKGGVVRHRHLLCVLAEDVLEVSRSLAEPDVDDNLGAVLECRHRLREVLAGGRERRGVDRELAAVVFFRGAANDQDVDRLDHLAAAERRGSAARDQLRLVGVVVEDLADAV
jgi:hypothetical protein